MDTSFDTLGIKSNLIDGLKKQGIKSPTDIQSAVIPLALDNKDIIGESETGSGKTLAYLLPIFQKINIDKKETQAILLAPTHELVMQIDTQIKRLAQNSDYDITSAAIIGEVNIKRQIEKLKEKPHIIVGSTGRILELIKSKKINSQTVKTIVIDEVDKLLDNNNIESVKNLIKTTMKDRQLMAFSATINQSVIDIAAILMKEASVVKIKAQHTQTGNINHSYVLVEQRDKIETLRKLVHALKPKKAIIFINKSDEIQLTTFKLLYHKFSAYGIYGSASKEDRKKALDDFRHGKIQLLVSSDLSARGLDVNDVTHIFNLDLPENTKEYMHRVGRTGRAGKTGTAVSIVTKKEEILLKKYEKEFHIEIEQKELSTGQLIQYKAPKSFSNPKKQNLNNNKSFSNSKTQNSKSNESFSNNKKQNSKSNESFSNNKKQNSKSNKSFTNNKKPKTK